jgi:hypothetical protein
MRETSPETLGGLVRRLKSAKPMSAVSRVGKLAHRKRSDATAPRRRQLPCWSSCIERVRARKVDHVGGATLKASIRESVDRKSLIVTDVWAAYRGIRSEFDGGHEMVTHVLANTREATLT